MTLESEPSAMKALLVDDHSLFRHGLALLLEQSLGALQVLHAADGETALQLRNQQPDLDLVLLDYNLGDDLGLDVLARLKAADPALPVVMVSGRDEPEIILSALGMGASGFISKHLEPSAMLQALQRILDGGMYVPPSLLARTGKRSDDQRDAFSQPIRQLADLARRVIRDKNLNLRAQAEIEWEMTSAFNHLLDEFQADRQRLAALAFYDELTGLGNRRLFLERLDQGLKAARRTNNPIALVYIDLDYFKQLNDTFGHAAGDALLQTFGSRLAQQVRETDTVARLGGDEFTMILTEVQPEAMPAFMERLYQQLKEPVLVANNQLWRPSASIGVAISQMDDSPDSLMQRADAVLYRVKQQGRNNVALG